MKRVMFFMLALALYAQPALAGHGFIEESDDGYYVEYTGDAGDKAAEAAKPGTGRAPFPFNPGAVKSAIATPPAPKADPEGEAIAQAKAARAEIARRDAAVRAQEGAVRRSVFRPRKPTGGMPSSQQ